MRFVRLAVVIALAAGCHSLRDEAVPACPFCGDPQMVRLADGSEVVVPRWRITEPPVVAPDAPASAARTR